MDTLFYDCSPDDPCYGCAMESLRREVEAGPPDDPVGIVRFAAISRLVAEANKAEPKVSAAEEVPF